MSRIVIEHIPPSGGKSVSPGGALQRTGKMTYRICRPTMALAFRDNHQPAVTIPAGKIIHVIGPAEDNRFVVVSMNDEPFLIFASDLADRGKQSKAAASAGSVI